MIINRVLQYVDLQYSPFDRFHFSSERRKRVETKKVDEMKICLQVANTKLAKTKAKLSQINAFGMK